MNQQIPIAEHKQSGLSSKQLVKNQQPNKSYFSKSCSFRSLNFNPESEQGHCTPFEGLINLLQTGIGIPVLYLPYLFKENGFIQSILLMLISGFLCYYSWMLMIKAIDKLSKSKRHTLFTITQLLLGENYEQFAQVVSMLFAYATNVVYFVFLINSLKLVTDEDYFERFGIPHDLGVAFLIMIFYLPLSYYEELENLTFFSKIGVFSFSVTFLCVTLNALDNIIRTGIDQSTIEKPFNLSVLPLYFGVIFFLFDVNGVITEIRCTLKQTSKFQGILQKYMLIMTALSIGIGLLGSFAYGQATDEIIFFNLGKTGLFSSFMPIISIMFCVSFLPDLAIFNQGIHEVLDEYAILFYFHNKQLQQFSKQMQNSSCSQMQLVVQQQNLVVEEEEHYIKKYKQNQDLLQLTIKTFIRIIVYMTQVGIAILYAHLTKLLNIAGCIFSVTLGFIYPYLLYRKCFQYKISTTEKYFNNLVLILGIGGGICGVYYSLMFGD